MKCIYFYPPHLSESYILLSSTRIYLSIIYLFIYLIYILLFFSTLPLYLKCASSPIYLNRTYFYPSPHLSKLYISHPYKMYILLSFSIYLNCTYFYHPPAFFFLNVHTFPALIYLKMYILHSPLASI
jgi:hypothetical protein